MSDTMDESGVSLFMSKNLTSQINAKLSSSATTTTVNATSLLSATSSSSLASSSSSSSSTNNNLAATTAPLSFSGEHHFGSFLNGVDNTNMGMIINLDAHKNSLVNAKKYATSKPQNDS